MKETTIKVGVIAEQTGTLSFMGMPTPTWRRWWSTTSMN